MVDVLIQGLGLSSWVELVAVVLSIVYVVLAAKENLWCWPAALISTALYAWLFFDVNLKQDSLLQVYYLCMAVYGWYMWSNTSRHTEVRIQRWSLRTHLLLITATLCVSLVSGYVAKTYFSSDYPYLDGLTTWFAVLTTYMVARKVLENWWYWVVIDIVSVYLYWQKGLYPTVGLYLVYVIIAVAGYFNWKKRWLTHATSTDQ